MITLVGLSVPINIRANTLTPHSVKVNWDKTSDATGYRISYNSAFSNGSESVNDGSTTTHSLENLKHNTQYTITVQTIGIHDRMSAESIPVTVSTPADSKEYIIIVPEMSCYVYNSTVPHLSPQNITVASTDPASLKVSWRLPSDICHKEPITGHVIQCTRVESNDDVVTKNVDEKTTHTISGLVAYTKYSVEVAAKTADGTGPFSDPEVEVSGENSTYLYLSIHLRI